MSPIIYGIDTEKQVTPLMVRDAILDCFFKAHCEDTGIDEKEKETNRVYCQEIVKKAFADAEANFENPTKKDILNVLQNLAEFAKSFRDQSIIKKHQQQIMQLVEKMQEDE